MHSPRMFDTVLIANRGEIALRVLRTCKEMGIRVVAVSSTEDRDSAVTRLADRVVVIGPGPARRSYLHVPAVIEAALATGAQAVHPGYGFLSENPDFAEICAAHDLVFIGPTAETMAVLGDKSSARRAMRAAGVPLLPGSPEAVRNRSEAQAVAREIGYPLIIKAVAGGGGRGMRVVTRAEDLDAAFADTVRTATALFGDGRVYLERYLASARHVEVQVLCDAYGNAVHLGARDCSVQRRHQKLVEEAPPPRLSPTLLDTMGRSAVDGLTAVGYRGVGTVEFLVDPDERFYFMEVNCRIQVEHPVTEAVTGLDLVREQLNVAAGRRLEFGQDDVATRGAAIEVRVNAEDPRRAFAPAPGRLDVFTVPGGPFVRVDTHAFPGYQIPSSYDSLLAKVIVWAPDRTTAIERARRALTEFRIDGNGIRTTAAFLESVIDSEEFRAATHDTALLARLPGPHL